MTTEPNCWSCGISQSPAKPHRSDFESEPAYLEAALIWIDFAYPKRVAQRQRIAAWHRLELERDPEYVRDRLVELFEDPSDEARVEFGRLADIWKQLDRTSIKETK